MKGADVVASILKQEGTEFLACYPRNPLIEACSRVDIRPILCRQERVGVGLADGFSRIRRGRQNGVFAAQQGPGIENAYPGVAQAYTENIPLLVIPAGYALRRQYQRPTFRAAEAFRSVTKWSAMAHSVQELPDLMRRAYHAMRTGPGGPVLVEIPDEVFEADFEGTLSYTPVRPYRAAPDPELVREAVRMLLSAKAPLIWAGAGVIYAEASEKLAALAEMLPAPVACTNPGKSAIADTHPLSLGASTRIQPRMYTEFMKRADVVFAIGSSMSRTSFGPQLPSGKRIIHSTNNPVDVNKDIAADLALIGDSALVLDALIEEVARQQTANVVARAAAMKEEIATIKAAWLRDWAKHMDSIEVPINQYRVLKELMQNVDAARVILTHDSGSPRKQVLPFWQTKVPGSYMGWGKSTQLGYGLGITMGAKLAAPDKLCINIMGDSAIGMTGMDIETASRNRIPILTIVFNNGVMAAERHVMEQSIEKFDSIKVGGNYAKLADALNVPSLRVDRPEEIASGIKHAVETVDRGSPFLLEFIVKEGYDFTA